VSTLTIRLAQNREIPCVPRCRTLMASMM
jgi:hypothetical protein